MSQNWYTAKELAGLPGLPGTHSAIVRKAKREGWEGRRRKGRGGGREYKFDSLPVEAQARLLKEQAPEPKRPSKPAAQSVTVDRESLWDAFERKPQPVRDEASRRLSALQAMERLAASGSGRREAVEAVAGSYGNSPAALYRWRGMVRGVDRVDWLPALAPRWGGSAGHSTECSAEAWETFKAFYLRPEAPSIAACYDWTCRAAREHGWTVPSQRTITRWVKQIPRTTRVLTREGELALFNLYPSQQRSVSELHAMQWINGDGYQHNVFVKYDLDDKDEKPWRPKTWFWQDIRSRMILAHRTDETENTDVIRLALGDVLERYGIPEDATIDNTRAAANKWLTGGTKTRYRFKIKEEDPLGLMPSLGIDVHWTTVHKGKGHGQAKPIERAFGVGGLGEYVDKDPRLSGAYTGPNVMNKPENYAERPVSFEYFLQVLADAIYHWNRKEGRRTEVCDGRYSYAQAFEYSYERAAAQIRRPTEAQRRMWMLAAESVSVKRDASLSLQVGSGPSGKNRYGGDALIPYAGQKVVVRFDPQNLHESVHIYQLDGRYIGEVECLHAAGFGDTQRGREWGRERTRVLRAGKDQARAESRMSALEAAETMPEPTEREDEPMDTTVRRGPWAEPAKAVSGSDVAPEQDDESPADRHRFDDQMHRQFRKFLDEV